MFCNILCIAGRDTLYRAQVLHRRLLNFGDGFEVFQEGFCLFFADAGNIGQRGRNRTLGVLLLVVADGKAVDLLLDGGNQGEGQTAGQIPAELLPQPALRGYPRGDQTHHGTAGQGLREELSARGELEDAHYHAATGTA